MWWIEPRKVTELAPRLLPTARWWARHKRLSSRHLEHLHAFANARKNAPWSSSRHQAHRKNACRFRRSRPSEPRLALAQRWAQYRLLRPKKVPPQLNQIVRYWSSFAPEPFLEPFSPIIRFYLGSAIIILVLRSFSIEPPTDPFVADLVCGRTITTAQNERKSWASELPDHFRGLSPGPNFRPRYRVHQGRTE